jgi:ribonuclease J
VVRIVPIGGVGEIGKNCMVVEYGDDAIVIDCGITFPDADMFGVDIVIPNFTYLREIRHKLRAFVVTHGHEDHIGALPYALREFDAPIYGSRLTLGLIEVKLEEWGIQAKLNTVKARDTIEIGPFRCEFFHVCHSIPDAMGLAIHTPVGTLVHTGDFKLDHTPVDGIPPDFQTLGRLGGDGVLLLMADSTYADRKGYTPSERVITETLDKVFAEAPGRIIMATFSSLVSRVQQLLDVADTYDRKVALIGRSMERTFKVASELGYLRLPNPDILIRADELDRYPADAVAVICTGSQGEPRSALVRMANRDHRQIEIAPDDTVILSASAIPGNEARVNRTIDRLIGQGASVLYEQLMPVHVSGHASQEELKFMLTTLQPKFFMPVHGERRHLVEHRRLAESVGVDGEHIMMAESGAVIEVSQDDIEIVAQTDASNVFVDGLGVGDVGEVVLRDRRHLSEDGVVVVVVTVDRHTGKCLTEPDIISRGFVYAPESEDLLEAARERVRQTIDEGDHPDPETDYLQNKIRTNLGRHLFQKTRRRPIILPIVTEV